MLESGNFLLCKHFGVIKSITSIMATPIAHAHPTEFMTAWSAGLSKLGMDFIIQLRKIFSEIKVLPKEYKFTIWLHPPFFSMFDSQFGHGLACSAIHWKVSVSPLLFHCLSLAHVTGSCQYSAVQSKQNSKPHVHLHGYLVVRFFLAANEQPTNDGHQRIDLLCYGKELQMVINTNVGCKLGLSTWTKVFDIERWYLVITSGSSTNKSTCSSSTRKPQFRSRHEIDWFSPSSTIFVVRYWPQQSRQNLWRQSNPNRAWKIIQHKLVTITINFLLQN